MRRVELGNLTQEDIQARSEDQISQGTVSDLERGKITLDSLNVRRASALARALNWSLAEMQRATGVDLGIVDVEPIGENDLELPVYHLQSLATPNPSIHSYEGFELRPDDKPDQLRVVLADNADMERPSGRSIHPGDAVFLRTDQTALEEHAGYAIVHNGRVLLRRYELLGTVPFFTADNPALSRDVLPVAEAKVLGRITRIASDFDYHSDLN